MSIHKCNSNGPAYAKASAGRPACRQAGFTLVELLVVILVVGTLAGVVIAVINPRQQQDRARDSGVLAALDKFILAGQAHAVVRGTAPTEQEFLAVVEKVVPMSGGECAESVVGANQSCRFSVEGLSLPNTCNIANWTGNATGTGQCYFYYYRDSSWDPERFRIFVRSWGLSSRTFVMDTSVQGVYHCDGNSLGADLGADLESVPFCEAWVGG